VTNNQNLTYDPVTGDNIPFTNIGARVYPEWGYVNGEYMQGWSNWHALVASFDKRFSNRWQLAGKLDARRGERFDGTAVSDGEGARWQRAVQADHLQAAAGRRG
jgi:hypothetical protein